MNKFCNVFLLNLILFSRNQHFEARVLSPLALNDARFNVGQNKHNNLKYSITENLQPFEESSSFSEPLQPYDSRQSKCLFKKQIAGEEPVRWSNGWYDECMNEVANKWINYWNRRRKKRVSRDQMLNKEPPLNFLDYTNSQMPFNEGQLRNRNHRATLHKFLESRSNEGEKDLVFKPYVSLVTEPEKYERLLMKRSNKVPVKSPEKNFETPQDNPILGYSRVRRFLDHERAKKRKRLPGTLEAKEAAMSSILDPNLNLDGILEPHVRKRRGKMNIFLPDRL